MRNSTRKQTKETKPRPANSYPDLSPVPASMFLTFGGRVHDRRSPKPVLHDTTAAEIAARMGYDTAEFPLPASKVFDIAVRARMLDDVVRGFVARHPDAVVLDLGVGMDSRAFRVDMPATVDWYEIDLPEVVALRRRFVPDRPHVHDVAADLTESHWLDEVPADRPAVVVADGLLPFLTHADLVAPPLRVFTRLTARSTALCRWGITIFHYRF